MSDAREELDRLNEGRAMHGLDPLAKLPDRDAAETFDASDEAQTAERAKRAEIAAKRRRSLVAAVMDTEQGRAWMWAMLTRCHVYAGIPPSTALAMAYAEGERNVGLFLLAEVQAGAPERYSDMIKEAARDAA